MNQADTVVAWGLVRVYLTVVGARSAYGAKRYNNANSVTLITAPTGQRSHCHPGRKESTRTERTEETPATIAG